MWIQAVKKLNYPPRAVAMPSEDPPHYEHSEIPQDRELHQGNSLSPVPQAPNHHRPHKMICGRKQIEFYDFLFILAETYKRPNMLNIWLSEQCQTLVKDLRQNLNDKSIES